MSCFAVFWLPCTAIGGTTPTVSQVWILFHPTANIFNKYMYSSHYNIHLVIMCRNVLDILLLWVHGGPLQHGLPLHLLLGLPPRWHFKAFWFDLNCFFLWIISVVIWFKIIFKQMISVVIWFDLFQQMISVVIWFKIVFRQIISVVIDLKMGLGSHTDARYEWVEDWGWKDLQQENIWIEDKRWTYLQQETTGKYLDWGWTSLQQETTGKFLDWGWKDLQQETTGKYLDWGWKDENICNKKQQEQQQCCQMK